MYFLFRFMFDRVAYQRLYALSFAVIFVVLFILPICRILCKHFLVDKVVLKRDIALMCQREIFIKLRQKPSRDVSSGSFIPANA